MFGEIPRNVWRHSPECLKTFPKCFMTFPEMFGVISRNAWRHFPEYDISPIPRFPHIPFPAAVFLVLYIVDNIPHFNTKHKFLRNSFVSSTIIE